LINVLLGINCTLKTKVRGKLFAKRNGEMEVQGIKDPKKTIISSKISKTRARGEKPPKPSE
jgi:hypothetical protein